MIAFYKRNKSPVGQLTLVANDQNLVAILWESEEPKRFKFSELILKENHQILMETEKQLDEYFDGTRTDFILPLMFHGTIFQKRVWHELMKIPFGKCASYRELAQKIGNPLAYRAVGGANGMNPLPIVVPCHRVIGTNGLLTGFAAGLEIKEFLLRHESKTFKPNLETENMPNFIRRISPIESL